MSASNASNLFGSTTPAVYHTYTPGEKPHPHMTAPNTLAVKVVGLNIVSNTNDHHTKKFAIVSPSSANPQLVVRRGQFFTIDVEFTRPFDRRKDDLKFVFEAGTTPLSSKATYVEFNISDEKVLKKWGATNLRLKGNSITIDIFTPPDCFIAKWVFKIDIIVKESSTINVYRYVHKNPIYVILNPWCTSDSVYLSDAELLKEYILNETGHIYIGSANSISSRPWNFGQFESNVLDLAIYLLDTESMSWNTRGDAVQIVRKMSALMNSNQGGVLEGKWSNSYEDGTAPYTWTGSVAILDEHWKTKQVVKYGQCWVFAGLTTTVCRALGIPARCITNFDSAHDTDGSITVDYHMKINGEVDTNLNNDMIWNFHVWSEAWMARPDLPPGYGGWQVIDATPQEASGDLKDLKHGDLKHLPYVPPLTRKEQTKSIKHGCVLLWARLCSGNKTGEVKLPYDGPFIFAEVNADKAYWRPNKFGVMKFMSSDEKSIGKCISTKSPKGNEREDLTLTYKYAEGSAEERAAVVKANQVGTNRHEPYIPTSTDVKFDIKQDSENTWLGSNFTIGLNMKNNSAADRTVSGRIVILAMYYTGVTAEKLKSEPFIDVVMKPGKEIVQNVVVTLDEYNGLLKDGYMVDVSILAYVKETKQIFVNKASYRLKKPNLSVTAPQTGVLKKEFLVDVSFVNPLKSILTDCVVTIDGVSDAVKHPQKNVIASGKFTASIPVVPKKVGNVELIIIFNSKQINDIHATCRLAILAA